MIERTVTFTKPSRHVPDPAKDGQVITYSTPAGSRLLRSFNLSDWSVVAEPSPFVHAGGDCHYLLECVHSAPVTATLAIGGGA